MESKNDFVIVPIEFIEHYQKMGYIEGYKDGQRNAIKATAFGLFFGLLGSVIFLTLIMVFL